MIRKAESLKDIMNLFEPGALQGEKLGFYQETAFARDESPYEFHENLRRRILDASGFKRLLVVGHGGCGKSTEMQMLEKRLLDDNKPAIQINALDDLDYISFTFIDVLVMIVDKIFKFVENKNLKINMRLIKAFQKALSTKTIQEYWNIDSELSADGSFSIALSMLINIVTKLSSSLKMASGFKEDLRREIKPKTNDIVNVLNAVIGEIQEQAHNPVVIIIDGLEKCLYASVHRLFVEDSVYFTNINAHIVISCPIALYRSADASIVSRSFNADETIPMIRTHNQDGTDYYAGINAIRQLVYKRADSSFFDAGVVDKIIRKTGGSLRDACSLVSSCAFEAMMKNNKTVDMASLDFAIKKFKIKIFFRITSALYPRVKKIYDGDFSAIQDSDLTELLYSEAVFEYDDERWVDLHPIVRDYIKARPGILDH